uniref:C2H2-type domain-containing protein n=1 Tax=Ditylenchus dipsaci TaxID=166011 RepID=A0A915DHD6_9BILA
MIVICTECQEKFRDVESLKCHLGKVHFQYSPYQCEMCLVQDLQSRFPTKGSVKRHCLEKLEIETHFVAVDLKVLEGGLAVYKDQILTIKQKRITAPTLRNVPMK